MMSELSFPLQLWQLNTQVPKNCRYFKKYSLSLLVKDNFVSKFFHVFFWFFIADTSWKGAESLLKSSTALVICFSSNHFHKGKINILQTLHLILIFVYRFSLTKRRSSYLVYLVTICFSAALVLCGPSEFVFIYSKIIPEIWEA